MADGQLESAAKAALSDAARFVLFDDKGTVLASNCKVALAASSTNERERR